MRIAFAGSPESAAATLRHLATKHEVVAVLTKPDASVGRSRVLTPNPVSKTAEQLGIRTIKSAKPSSEDVRALIDLGADLCIVVAYGALLSKEVLELGIPFWNVHFSLLPHYRGATPVQAAIIDGACLTGVTIFEIDQGLDTGPIIAQTEVVLVGNENTQDLLDDLTRLSQKLLDEVLAAPFPPKTKQQIGTATHSSKISRAEAQLSLGMPLPQLDALVRAYGQSPGTWLNTNLGQVRVIEGIPLSGSETLTGSSGLRQIGKRVLMVLKGGQSYELKLVQPPGKRAMPAIDWWHGLREEIEIV